MVKNLLKKLLGILLGIKYINEILPLSPKSDLDSEEYNVYDDCLDLAIKNKDVNNMAVTGDFGIGKSSILKTYSKRKKKKFMFLSLAEFSNKNHVTTINENKKVIRLAKTETQKNFERNKFEMSLLSQIISQCKHKDIPQSNIKLVPEQSNRIDKSFFAFLLSIDLIMLLSIIFSETVADYLHIIFEENLHDWYLLLCVEFGILSVFLFGFGFYKLITYTRVKEVSAGVKGSNAELNAKAESDEFILERNKFELIYIFEQLAKKGYKAVVFEDMDRIDHQTAIEIFTFMREMSNCVNSRLGKKKICFIYTINDEVIAKLKYTKFFDYVMSVVPTLGEKNIEVTIRNLMQEVGISEIYDKYIKILSSLNDLSDYRTLNQIKNEFAILFNTYYIRFTFEYMYCSIDKIDVFSFAIYKTICPDDYNKIRQGNSILFHNDKRDNDIQVDTKYNVFHQLIENGFMDKDICLRFVGFNMDDYEKNLKDILKYSTSFEFKERKIIEDMDGFQCLSEIILKSDPIVRKRVYSGVEDLVLLNILKNERISDPKIFKEIARSKGKNGTLNDELIKYIKSRNYVRCESVYIDLKKGIRIDQPAFSEVVLILLYLIETSAIKENFYFLASNIYKIYYVEIFKDLLKLDEKLLNKKWYYYNYLKNINIEEMLGIDFVKMGITEETVEELVEEFKKFEKEHPSELLP